MTFKGFKTVSSPMAKFYNACVTKSGFGGKKYDKHDDDHDHGNKFGHWKDHKAWPHADHDHDHGKAATKWHHPHHNDRDYGCPPKNAAPVITSPVAFTVAENTTGVGTVVATDANHDAIVYSISGGADAALFRIDPATGALGFKSAPDFEMPKDQGGNNVYDITIGASDGKALTTQAVQVTVTDVNENVAPVITSPAAFTVAENTTGVGTVVATDANLDAVVYAITGGADAGLFDIDPALGTLVFKTAPDFESPADAGANNVYDLTVSASDGTAVTAQDVQVTVNDVAENNAPQITGFTDFVRGRPVVIDISTGTASAGIRISEDGQVGFVQAIDPDGDTLVFAITGGSDASVFEIDQFGRLFTLDSVTPFGDEDGDDIYEFAVTVDDGNGGQAVLNMEYFVLAGT